MVSEDDSLFIKRLFKHKRTAKSQRILRTIEFSPVFYQLLHNFKSYLHRDLYLFYEIELDISPITTL